MASSSSIFITLSLQPHPVIHGHCGCTSSVLYIMLEIPVCSSLPHLPIHYQPSILSGEHFTGDLLRKKGSHVSGRKQFGLNVSTSVVFLDAPGRHDSCLFTLAATCIHRASPMPLPSSFKTQDSTMDWNGKNPKIYYIVKQKNANIVLLSSLISTGPWHLHLQSSEIQLKSLL